MNRRHLVALCLLVPSIAGADPLDDAKLLLKKRKFAEAIVQLEPLAKTDTTGEATFALAIAFELSGNSAKAIESYRKVIDGKGRRAAEADRAMKALEVIANNATALERARLDAERAGLEGSTRLKEARARAETARNKLIDREREVQKKQREREAAMADGNEAARVKQRAEKLLVDWKNTGLAAPSGKGGKFRTLGTVLTALGGIGVGASLWYMWTAQTATEQINMAPTAGVWTNELEHYSEWGAISDSRLPYSLVLGGGLTLFGLAALGFGEAALDDTADRARTARDLGDTP